MTKQFLFQCMNGFKDINTEATLQQHSLLDDSTFPT